MFDIDDLIDDLNDDGEFEEIPVDIDTFMGKGYLEQTGVTLSHYQKEMIEHMTQIFRYETLLWDTIALTVAMKLVIFSLFFV